MKKQECTTWRRTQLAFLCQVTEPAKHRFLRGWAFKAGSFQRAHALLLIQGRAKLLWNHSTFIAFHNPIRILQDWNRKRKSSWKMLGASSPHIHPKLELATRSAGFKILCSASMIGTSRTATWERDFEAFDAPGWLNQWSSIGGFVGQSPVATALFSRRLFIQAVDSNHWRISSPLL